MLYILNTYLYRYMLYIPRPKCSIIFISILTPIVTKRVNRGQLKQIHLSQTYAYFHFFQIVKLY